MPTDSFGQRIKRAFTTGQFSTELLGWIPQRLKGSKVPTRIEPEIYQQERQIHFDQYGVRKAVGGKFGEFSNDGSQFVIERPSGSTIDSARAMENFKGLVYASINAVAREVMNIDWRLFQVKGKNHKEVASHELLDLIDTVNDFLTSAELKYYLSAHMHLTGNAYWYLDGVKSISDKPTAIHPIIPSTITTLIDKTTWPYKLKGYRMKLEGGVKSIYFEPYQILQFRNPNPLSFFEGMSPVQAAAEYIDNDTYLWEYNRKFFVNGARPSGFLQSEMVSETQIESLKIGFANMHQGIDNMQRIAVLPKGVTWQSAGTSPKDMDFKNLSEDTKERILMMFGVSKTILGTAESDTNRATAETADYVFSKRVIKPHMDLICAFLNRFLVSRYGDDFYISYLDPVPEDRAARTEEMKTSVGGAPVLTPNEAREEFMGLGPVEGGDSLYVPSGMAPAGMPTQDGNVSPDAPGGTPDVGKAVTKDIQERRGIKTANGERVAFRPARSRFKTFAKKSKEIGEALAEKITDTLKYAAEHPTVKFKATREEQKREGEAFTERTRKAEQELAEIVRELNNKQKEEVLANLEKAIEKTVDPRKLFDIDSWISIFSDAVAPPLESLYENEGKAAAAQVGKPDLNPLSDNAAKAALHRSIQLLAESYNQTTLDTLEAKLNEGISEGQSIAEMTDSVSQIYEWSDNSRAERVAKTESFRTANTSLKEAWKQSGVVKTIVWDTSQSNNVCDFCAEMDGRVISIEENFFDQGDSLTIGEGDNVQTLSLDYSDVEAPPLHPNCMCFARPEDISPLE